MPKGDQCIIVHDMGIQGLLPFLKAIHTPVNIADFPGATVAIDAYCWLHKGAFSCAEKLALGEKTDQYVFYCMKYIEYMLRKNLKPILVFDGGHLKSKADVEKTRRERRELHRKKAAQFLREGKRTEAKECLQRCVDITPQMALELMNACRDRGVDCIVAPYEADAQLAYLNLRGIADIIVTEDSDLLLFGCEKIIFKMDLFGNGTLIEKSCLNEVLSIKGGFYTFEKFRYMCILSGCDYLPSIPGIGLAKACKVIKTARQPDVRQLLRKLPTYLKTNMTVKDEYIEGFVRADNTFLYQLVFDPISRKLCPLNPYPPEVQGASLDYAGEYLPEEKAYQIAIGNIDVHSHKCISYFDPDSYVPKNAAKPKFRHQLSIWDKNYCIKSGSPCKEIQVDKEDRKTSLHDKELTIRVQPFKHSPSKRARTVDDLSEMKTDEDLVSLYADADENLNPDTRKVRRSLENSFSSVNSDNVLGEEKMNDLKATTPKTSNSCIQNLQDNKNSDDCSDIRHVNESSDIKHVNESSDSEEEKPMIPRKRKLSVSPWKPSAANIGEDAFKATSVNVPGTSGSAPSPSRGRNLFAVTGGSAKLPKFDLNTPAVHVRSRYFVSSSMAGQTTANKQGTPVTQKLRQTSQKAAPQKDSLVQGQKSIQAMFENVPVRPQQNAHQEQQLKPATKSGILKYVSPVSLELPSAKDSFRNLKHSGSKNDCTAGTSCFTSNKGHVQETRRSLAGLDKFQSNFSPGSSKQTPSKRSSGSAFNWSKYQAGLGVGASKFSISTNEKVSPRLKQGVPQIKEEKDRGEDELDNDRQAETEIASQRPPDLGKASCEGQSSCEDEDNCSLAGDTHDDDVFITPDQKLQNIESEKICLAAGAQSDVIKRHSVTAKFVDESNDVIELKSCSYSDFLRTFNEKNQSGASENAAEVDDGKLACGTESSELQAFSDVDMDSTTNQIIKEDSQASDDSDSPAIDDSPALEARGTSLSLLEEDHMPDRIHSAKESFDDSDVKSGCDQDDVIDLTDAEADSQSSPASVLSSSSTSNVLRQTKCRVSGLSRNKGKSVKKSNSTIAGQRSIKDLMSKFQYKS
ncbi:hypothetical protein BsWGS_15243 [Bradybaena similaris]